VINRYETRDLYGQQDLMLFLLRLRLLKRAAQSTMVLRTRHALVKNHDAV